VSSRRVLVELAAAPRMFLESFRISLYVIPVNQVRDRYLSSNCHKHVNLLQIILRMGEMFRANKDDLLRGQMAVLATTSLLDCWRKQASLTMSALSSTF
jgi:hypothetical protein